jgi:hypothetical protein
MAGVIGKRIPGSLSRAIERTRPRSCSFSGPLAVGYEIEDNEEDEDERDSKCIPREAGQELRFSRHKKTPVQVIKKMLDKSSC